MPGNTEKPNGAIAQVTLAYWAFMLTDGALRMLVLLHFHNLGFSALSLAYLFVAYEFMGVVTNIVAGWLGTRRGIYTLIFSGLVLQTSALLVLAFFNPVSTSMLAIGVVMVLQGFSGVAKDLIKTGAKSAMKLLSDEKQQSPLFRLVATLTGSKNAIKGLGFFVGASLLATLGFVNALFCLAILLALVVASLRLSSRPAIGTTDSTRKFSDVLSPSATINKLSVARLFLFGARDTWFVVALPIFLHTSLKTHTQIDSESAYFVTGGFLAVWIIAYGFVQAMAPRLLKNANGVVSQSISDLQRWSLTVAIVLMVLSLTAGLTLTNPASLQHLTATFFLLFGLLVFGVAFALCSSLHSYLILALTNHHRATSDVGFYYMANAAGRLIGTVLSGVSYQFGGITSSLIVASVMAGISFLLSRLLRESQ